MFRIGLIFSRLNKKLRLVPSRQLPKIFTINHHHGCQGSIEIVEQLRVDVDAEGASSAGSAEMVRDKFGLSAVDRIAGARCSEVELFSRVIGMQHAGWRRACKTAAAVGLFVAQAGKH